MDQEKLKKANKLNSEIKTLEESLMSFEWSEGDYNPEIKKTKENTYSTNPTLQINYDAGDCREGLELPGIINDKFITILKKYIEDELLEKKNEFRRL